MAAVFGNVIREIRKKKGLTQAQFVAKLNIDGWDLSRGTFSKIEARIRCVTDYELLKLAEGLGVDATELLRRATKLLMAALSISPTSTPRR